MKKIYLSVLSMAVVMGVSAQVTTTELAPKHSTFSNVNNSTAATSFEKISLWSNDISTAADWTFTNTSTPAQDWYIETDPTAVPTFAPVGMTSAANGFLMIDSDGAGAAGLQDAYAQYSGVIDLTGEPNVTLEFEHHFRAFQEARAVEVSNDGGSTWTAFEVTASSVANVNVSETFSVDISAVAGGQANVTIRFHYVGNFGWYWAVDDINIKQTEPFDLRADGTSWGVSGSWGPRLPYYTTPTDQIQPIEFCGINTNVGVNTVADATYAVGILSAGYVGTGTISSAPGSTDTICATAAFTPAGVGSYTASATMTTISPDTGTNNNDFEDVTFGVDPYIYARDNSAAAATVGGSFNSGDGFETGNIFDIYTADDLQSIRVGINTQAVAGASVYVKLYTIDGTGNFALEAQSVNYTLTAADLGSYIDLALLGGAFPLAAGESYLVTAGSDGDGGFTNDLVVMTAGVSEAQTTFYYDATDLTWYYSTATSAVQMNFDPSISVNENENVFGMSVFPNPANAEANVTFSLNNTANVNITVTDLSGKVVYSNAIGNVAAGTNTVSLNTDALSNGVYMINVAADNAVSTEKLIIRK